MVFNLGAAMDSILSPPILFFFLGVIAVFVHSDLEIPKPIPKLFSIYLLTDIGFKGGVELFHSGLNQEVFLTLGVCVMMSILVPFYCFFLLRNRVGDDQAAGIAATYGSVSAVTFITAVAFLDFMKVAYGGHMVAAMALMESPAIIAGVVINMIWNRENKGKATKGILHILHEACFNGSVFLIMGALIVGIITNEKGWNSFKAFDGIFKGMLMLYLLDMGIHAAREIKLIRQAGWQLVAFAIGVPIFNATIGILLSKALGVTQGDAMLVTVLCASASYIAVPAALPNAIPKCSAAMCTTMSLGITFPFNVIIGIPVYYSAIQAFIPA
jgi:hypothetical protein